MHPLAIYTSDMMKAHTNAPSHPECPERLSVIREMIDREFIDVPVEQSFPADEDKILLAHPQSYLDDLLDNTPFDGWHAIDGDTALNEYSYDSALLSAGTALSAMYAVVNGEAETAFALSRPPGHHAEYETAMGFCFFANAFIAAKASGIKTLIIDFDVHHGNGTEDIVKQNVSNGQFNIAYASTHEANIFPNTGMEDSQNICNCPLPHNATSDNFRHAITNKIIPFATDFKPELIIFSAGFDGHESDPLASMKLRHDDFGWIVDQIRPICPKIVSILEGGYNLDTLGESVKYHLKALANT